MPTHLIADTDSGNYTELETDGSLHFVGDATVFRDEFGDITKLKIAGVGIVDNLTDNSVGFQTTCDYANDYLISNFQFNHDRKLNAVVYPHIHWFQTQSIGTNPIPNFLVQYRWQHNGAAKTTGWTNLIMKTNAFTYVSGTLNQITYGAGITPPVTDGVSPILQVRITRDKQNVSNAFGVNPAAQDTHTATADVTSFDIHIEVDTIGSRTEYSK